jgi:arylsulfatase A-like enzyme
VVGLLGLLLDAFRELGIYEDALIAVIADHGMWGTVAEVRIPEHIRRLHSENGEFPASDLPERKGSVLPLVLIKQAGSSGPMKISDAPVELSDIPRTIVSELGLDARSFPGRSMFNIAEFENRERKVYFSTFKSNPPYSEPYRSNMTEFVVDGFSWLDRSWSRTGNVFPPAGGYQE